MSVPVDPGGLRVWETTEACHTRPVDSSLALLSQQEGMNDEGCLVSREDGVGED